MILKMKELIDKKAALESVCHNCCCDPEECKRDNSYCADYMSILNLSTIEVAHGQWTERYVSIIGQTRYFCSECLTFHERKSNYCPNCGAKMDLEE